MKRNIIIWIIVGVILVALMVLAANISTLKGNNKTLEITKEINAGIPFKWEYVIEDPNIVEFKKSYVIRDDNKGGLVGGKVTTNYVFVGKKEGETTITFRFVSITNEDYPPEEEVYKIKVDKDLNISLVTTKNE